MWGIFTRTCFRSLAAGLYILPLIAAPSWADQHYDKAILLTLASSKSVYSKGEPVELLLTVINTSKTPLTVPFSSAKQYDFVIKKDGQEVWRWSQGKMFAMALTQLKLEPRGGNLYRATWSQADGSKKQVGPGTYEATATLLVSGHLLSANTSIEIK